MGGSFDGSSNGGAKAAAAAPAAHRLIRSTWTELVSRFWGRSTQFRGTVGPKSGRLPGSQKATQSAHLEKARQSDLELLSHFGQGRGHVRCGSGHR